MSDADHPHAALVRRFHAARAAGDRPALRQLPAEDVARQSGKEAADPGEGRMP